MAVLEITATLAVPRVDVTIDHAHVSVEVATLTLSAELIKPKLDLDDPSAV